MPRVCQARDFRHSLALVAFDSIFFLVSISVPFVYAFFLPLLICVCAVFFFNSQFVVLCLFIVFNCPPYYIKFIGSGILCRNLIENEFLQFKQKKGTQLILNSQLKIISETKNYCNQMEIKKYKIKKLYVQQHRGYLHGVKPIYSLSLSPFSFSLFIAKTRSQQFIFCLIN